MGLQDKNLGLFMTRGMSLEKWAKLGTLAREIKPYNELAKDFKTIYIFSYGRRDSTLFAKDLASNLKVLPRPRHISVFLYSLLLPFIQKKTLKNIDILKTNQMDGSWAAVLAKKMYKKHLVVRCGYEWLYTIQKNKKSFLKRWTAFIVEKFAYSNADKIILTSSVSKDFVLTNFNVNSSKIEIISNYIDTELFRPMNIEKDPKRILFVGRLEKDKNPKNLILACAGTQLRVVLIGEGSQKDYLKKLAAEKNVEVIFFGQVDQTRLPEEINKSQIFVLPSYMEGNPKSLLEAMSCGVACVGSDIEGINNLIRQGENGILSVNDPESLRHSITKVVKDDVLCKKLGSNARLQIENENSLQFCLNKELKLYQSL